jgi:hypothetical protein
MPLAFSQGPLALSKRMNNALHGMMQQGFKQFFMKQEKNSERCD